MDTLILAQTVFYVVASIVLISLGILFSISGYHLMQVTKNLRGISENINNVSTEVKEKISELSEKISNFSPLSFFSGKDRRKKRKPENKTKGRSNS